MTKNAEAQIIRCPKCGANNRVNTENADRQAVCGRCKTPLEAVEHPIIVTDSNFSAEVEKSPLPVLVDFWAAWCGPCRVIAPVIEALARELSGRVRVGKLDVDQNPAVSERFGVRSIPTLLIFKDGKEIDRIVGAASKEVLLQRLQAFL